MLTTGCCCAQLSKKCPFVIKSNLNPVSGNVTWTIPNTVPYATYMLRAFVYRNVTQANGKNISQPLATGVSVGYFQVRYHSASCLVSRADLCLWRSRHCPEHVSTLPAAELVSAIFESTSSSSIPVRLAPLPLVLSALRTSHSNSCGQDRQHST